MNFIQKLKYIKTRNKLLFGIIVICFSYYLFNNLESSYKIDMPINCITSPNFYLGEDEASFKNKRLVYTTNDEDFNSIYTSYYGKNYKIYYSLTFSPFFRRIESINTSIHFDNPKLLVKQVDCITKSLSDRYNLDYYLSYKVDLDFYFSDKINNKTHKNMDTIDLIYFGYHEFNNDFFCYFSFDNNESKSNQNNIDFFFCKNYFGSFNSINTNNKNDRKISEQDFYQLLEKYKTNKMANMENIHK